MSRYQGLYEEDTILKVISAYIVNGWSHREIQKKILGLPAPSNGGGFVAMDILHYYGIKGEHKGILSNNMNFDLSQLEMQEANSIINKVLEIEQIKSAINKRIESKQFQIFNFKTTVKRETLVRINQDVLRNRVMKNYNHECALCGIKQADLLICSHIKPWAIDEANRLNPRNAICFCAIHDKLFDRGYFGIDENFIIVLSTKCDEQIRLYLNGCKFKYPEKEKPDRDFLDYHMNYVVVK